MSTCVCVLGSAQPCERHPDASGGRLTPSRASLLLPPSCPAKFREAVLQEPPPTPAMEFGSVFHHLTLGEGDEYTVLDPEVHGLTSKGVVADFPKSTAMWKAAEAKARADDVIPIHVDDYTRAEKMAQAVHEHPLAGPLLSDGTAEYSLTAEDPETGVLLSGRLDWMTMIGGGVTVVDLKSALSAHPATWARKAYDFGTHIQAAFYEALIILNEIDIAPDVRFVLVEKEPPFLVSVARFDPPSMRKGRTDMRRALEVYRRCYDSGVWPGYGEQLHDVSLPPWAIYSN